MSEDRVVGHRGNIKGRAIYFGTAEVTITGAAVSGVSTITFDPTYDDDPTVLVGLPDFDQTSGGATNFVTGQHTSTDDVNVRIAIHAWVDTAPGSYKTVTLTYPYIIIGEPND